jgi:hypothetical protein
LHKAGLQADIRDINSTFRAEAVWKGKRVAAIGKEIGMTKSLLVVLSIALLVIGAGCQLSNEGPTSPSSTPPEPSGALDLDSPTGGMTTSDEPPAFGEPDEYAVLVNETDVSDPYGSSNEYQNMIRVRGARLYDFRAVWGHLARMSDSTNADACPLDWSGTLRLRGGMIIVEKRIAFEPQDSLIRVDRSTIRWISHTGPGIDGIEVRLLVPGKADTSKCADCPPPVLEFVTGLYSRNFTMDELVNLDLVQPVDRCGNGISITSVLSPPACPHGHLMGAWRHVPPDTSASPDSNAVRGTVLGTFRGIWIGEHGLIGGYLRGVYGLNSAGERVFFGKYIDRSGRFAGILRGTYGPRPELAATDDRNPHGIFSGEWVGKNAELKGRLKGHWIAEESGYGYFHGVWGMLCAATDTRE